MPSKLPLCTSAWRPGIQKARIAFGMSQETWPERAHLDAVRLQEVHCLGLQHAPPLCISPVCMAVRLCLECAQILLQVLAAERAPAVFSLQHILSLQIHNAEADLQRSR